MSVLAQICADKMDHVRRAEHLIPQVVLEEKTKIIPPARGFADRLRSFGKSPAVIAEIKKASPSKGVIRADFNPVQLARDYELAGAACLSVLTDIPYFKGHDEDLEAARAATRLPIIRKDFMLTPYQVVESRALGADCILLIMAALEDNQARDLMDVAAAYGLDVLIEVHDEPELDRALALKPQMVGVNSRNLKTLDVSLKTAEDLVKKIPDTVIRIAESGISDHATLKHLHNLGYNAFLVGESLMKQPSVRTALENLLGNRAESV